jgi:hypothetical protein
MRTLLALAVLAAASPAAAQLQPLDQHQLMELQAQAELARQRSVAVENQLMSLEARLRAEEAIATSRAQSVRPVLPLPAYPEPAGAESAKIDTSKLVSIPDDRLAASNAAVVEASRPPR